MKQLDKVILSSDKTQLTFIYTNEPPRVVPLGTIKVLPQYSSVDIAIAAKKAKFRR